MIKKILWGVGIVVIAFSLYIVYTLMTHRKHSPPETVSYKKGNSEISIDYCRPSKKGRAIFGALVPYDSYWRTGANEATIINFTGDVEFAGETLKAGKYRLYTIPGENEWTVVLNTELEEWGAWEPDYEQDILKVKSEPKMTDTVVEQFKIELVEGDSLVDLTLAWDQTKVSVPIKI